jgi:hypothetical protein
MKGREIKSKRTAERDRGKGGKDQQQKCGAE